ncbi:glycosyltransferase family 2 protein [Pedobacter miscanthi]|uniref:Glycosyltransferase 2-like domain-containing protein n=1 Tax=Pedobacter miscanthi TaxID=2259170 RepID=A0A366LEC6_9SPHI|nr:glycosyltransferase family A protein [Pedobacter miscanthi]RBQ11502.1 hypothetical protein DRW42_03300 [Pedobacter miscanthi]
MMSVPLFSIIIPVHNAVAFLENTLFSVAYQTEMNWECLVVNDHSDDGSDHIYRSFKERDKRFKIFNSEKKGANAARNLGIAMSSSRRLIFLDADDLLEENCISDRMKFIYDNGDYDMYVFKTEISDGSMKTGLFSRESDLPAQLISAFIRHEIPWHTTSVVWDRVFIKKIGGWNEAYQRLQDVEINIRALLKGARMRFGADRPDSIYVKGSFTAHKVENALYASCNLITDYYAEVVAWIGCDEKDEVIKSFETLISKTLGLYVNMVKYPVINWENKFLNVLRRIGAEKEEIDYVITVFKVFADTVASS